MYKSKPPVMKEMIEEAKIYEADKQFKERSEEFLMSQGFVEPKPLISHSEIYYPPLRRNLFEDAFVEHVKNKSMYYEIKDYHNEEEAQYRISDEVMYASGSESNKSDQDNQESEKEKEPESNTSERPRLRKGIRLVQPEKKK